MVKKITVLGGGAVAHSITGQLSLKGYEVTLYDLPNFRTNIESALNNKTIKLTGKVESTASIHNVTTDIGEAIKDAELIFLTAPAFGYETFMDLMIPFLRKDQKVVMTGGNYGPLIFHRKLKEKKIKGIIIGDTNMCPMGGRMIAPGEVRCTKRPSVQIAAFPSKDTGYLMETLNPVIDDVGTEAEDIVETALNNLGQVGHPSAMVLNAGTIDFAFMEKREYFLYREGLSPTVANVIEAVDRERLEVARKMGYDPETLVEELGGGKNIYEVFRGARFHNSSGPWGFEDRYFIEDLPFGLVPITQLGKIVDTETKIIDAIITIASTLVGKNFWTEGLTSNKLGIEGLNLDQLKNYLHEGVRID